MEKPRTTPKDFFLWAGAMVSLYWAAIAFILLTFNYIDYAFPNALGYLPPNPYDTGIGFEMASIVVFLPIYMALSWLIRRDMAADITRKDIWVRRWALILTLFVAGATMAFDLVAVLAAFFGGEELTMAFVLKVLILLMVAAVAFMHFIADYWGYWEQNPHLRQRVCWSIGLLAVLSIASGFVLFGTPAAARQYRLDEQRVSDLQNIQWQITSYWQRKQALPQSLADINDPLANYSAPTDPATNAPYTYRATGAKSFELCADFSRPSMGQDNVTIPEPAGLGRGSGPTDSWQHGASTQCFDRTIDPELYPPTAPKAVPAQ